MSAPDYAELRRLAEADLAGDGRARFELLNTVTTTLFLDLLDERDRLAAEAAGHAQTLDACHEWREKALRLQAERDRLAAKNNELRALARHYENALCLGVTLGWPGGGGA